MMIMGSNMAECHPVAFRWPVQAKAKGAKIIHVDPRFTRTSAMADLHVAIRAGTDVAFLGGLINYVINSQRWNDDPFFREYLVNFTNAATIVHDDYKDTDDLEGVFSGYDPAKRSYANATWAYQRGPAPAAPAGEPKTFAEALAQRIPGRMKEDRTLQDPRTAFQILKRHFARYTPEMVASVSGCTPEQFRQVAETLLNNSGRERTSSIIYAVGWTQHINGTQMIRAAAILQMLLGNIGRPGGGVQALRGHAQVQGATDISTLYHAVPGYLAMPSALAANDTLKDYVLNSTLPNVTAYWSNLPNFWVSYLKAMYGDAATKENDYGYDYHPKITGDHSHLPMFVAMSQGQFKGFFAMGQNPAVGGVNASFQRKALAQLDWLVVRDPYETETAAFWRSTSPEVKSGQLDPKTIKTEVFLLPAAACAEGDGSFTNTGRLIQWHDKAADPPGDARTDTWFTFHLGKRLKALYQSSTAGRDWPIKNLLWDYDSDPEEVAPWRIKDEPSAVKIMKEINGYEVTPQGRKQLASFANLKEDGTTVCGAWIYTGVMPDDKTNRAASRKGTAWISPQWGFAWPANRHIMYNRASADAAGKPWSDRKKLVWWDAGKKLWVGEDGEVPDMIPTKAPDARGSDTAVGVGWQNGTDPFIMKPDGKAWLFAPAGLTDGPLPAHYEPWESPVPNAVYKQQSSPVARAFNVPGNTYHKAAGDEKYPIVVSTYRLTEHHLSGVMTRWLPWLAELMPELFCEISPELAAEKQIVNSQYVKISTARGAIKARALVTRRMRPFNLNGKVVHEIGLPWHWGYQGHATGDVTNDISALIGEPNVTIHEAKAFTCNVEAVPGGVS